MCQLCVRSEFWELWKQFQLSQVRQVSVCGRSAGLMFAVVVFGFLSFPLFSSSHWSSRCFLLRGVPLLVSSSGAGVVLLCYQMCVLFWCVLCVMEFCSVCHPTLLQIYYWVCGPWECFGAENIQGSPSIENYFCHSRWDSHLNTKAEFTDTPSSCLDLFVLLHGKLLSWPVCLTFAEW